MLECLQIRDEQNFSSNLHDRSAYGPSCLKYGKFSFGNLEKGQGLTLANALRRILLYEFPAYGVTTLSLKKYRNSDTDGKDRRSDADAVNNQALRNISDRIVDDAQEDESMYHEFSNLPGVKESVIEILSNFKSLIFTPAVEDKRLNDSTKKERLGEPGIAETTLFADLENRIRPSKGFLLLTAEGPSRLSVEQESIDDVHRLPSGRTGEHKIYASQLQLPQSIVLVNPTQVLATLISQPVQSTLGAPYTDDNRTTGMRPEDNSSGTFSRTNVITDTVGETKGLMSSAVGHPSSLDETFLDKGRLDLPDGIAVRGLSRKEFQPLLIEFTIDQITQTNLTNPYSFSGRAPLRSTRYRRLLPVDGTEFPIKKVNYTIEQDVSGKEVVFFEIWTNGAIQPKEAIIEAIKKSITLFQKFQ